VSGLCGNNLATMPVEKEVEVTYLGDARLGRRDCGVFCISLYERYEGLARSQKTPYGELPVSIDSVKVARTRTVWLARGEGKLVAYDARHWTEAEFSLNTPLWERRFETEAVTPGRAVLHAGREQAGAAAD
jgi:hypothetical protein